MDGIRPDLNEITGPTLYEEFARSWIEKCWDDQADKRPTFAGEMRILSPSMLLSFGIHDMHFIVQFMHTQTHEQCVSKISGKGCSYR